MFNFLMDATMKLRFGIIGILNHIIMFLLPAKISKHIREGMKNARGGEMPSLGDFYVGHMHLSDEDVLGTTTIGITDLGDGSVALGLAFEPEKQAAIEQDLREGKQVPCSPGEGMAQSIVKILLSSTPEGMVKHVTLPGGGTRAVHHYRGYCVLGDLTPEREREIDEKIDSGESPDVIVSSINVKPAKERMH